MPVVANDNFYLSEVRVEYLEAVVGRSIVILFVKILRLCYMHHFATLFIVVAPTVANEQS